jgi:hypothetical protein
LITSVIIADPDGHGDVRTAACWHPFQTQITSPTQRDRHRTTYVPVALTCVQIRKVQRHVQAFIILRHRRLHPLRHCQNDTHAPRLPPKLPPKLPVLLGRRKEAKLYSWFVSWSWLEFSPCQHTGSNCTVSVPHTFAGCHSYLWDNCFKSSFKPLPTHVLQNISCRVSVYSSY